MPSIQRTICLFVLHLHVISLVAVYCSDYVLNSNFFFFKYFYQSNFCYKNKSKFCFYGSCKVLVLIEINRLIKIDGKNRLKATKKKTVA